MIIDGEQQALENLMKLIEDNCQVRDGAQQNIEAAIAKLMVESRNCVLASSSWSHKRISS